MIATVMVSVVGFVAFLAALEGTEVPGLGFGLAELLSFDTLALWTRSSGVALLPGHDPTSRFPDANPRTAPACPATSEARRAEPRTT